MTTRSEPDLSLTKATTADLPSLRGSLDSVAAPWRRLNWPTVVIAGIVLVLLPFVIPVVSNSPSSLIQLLISFFVFCGIAQCWNLVLGVSGIFSLAQLALYAIGGYTSALLALEFGAPTWLAILCGPLGAVLASLIIGLAVLRLRGVYIALLTLAFVELIRNFLTTGPEVFGRGFGLRLPTLFSGENALEYSYFFGLAIFAVTTFAVWRVIYSPIGMAFTALRDAEGYAVTRGISPFKLKLWLFAYSAFFTGLIGSFAAFWQGLVTPSLVDFNQLIFLVMMIVLGGWGTFLGPIVGAAVLMLVDELWLNQLGAGWSGLALGVFLMIIVISMPEGVVPVIGRRIQASRQMFASFT